MLPSPPPSPSLRIDGVAQMLSALVVPTRYERLPGGLSWSLELHRDTIAALHALAARSTGKPSPSVERQLWFMLGKLLGQGGRPRFCVATIDMIEVGAKRVRLTGRCAPLLLEALGSGSLTRILT